METNVLLIWYFRSTIYGGHFLRAEVATMICLISISMPEEMNRYVLTDNLHTLQGM